MKNKILFAFAALTLAACSDDEADNYAVRLDRTAVEAGPLSGVYEVRVRSNCRWNASVRDASFAGWLTVTEPEGPAGEGTFFIGVEANETGEPRTAQVVVGAGSASEVVTVTQSPASDGSVVKLDRVVRSDYTGEMQESGSGYLVFELRGGELGTDGKPAGRACVLSIGCFADMPADPERAVLDGGIYTAGTAAECASGTFAADGGDTFLDIYDEEANHTRFDIASGSEFHVLSSVENFYSISGSFVNEEGRVQEWYFEGYIKFRNAKGLTTDADGYKILRADGLMEARYEGNIDGYGTAKVVFDVRDPFMGDGMNIAAYVATHPEFDEPGGASLALGTYSFGNPGDPHTIEAGYVENGLPYGSHTYQIDGMIKLVMRMIVGGTITVSRYNTEEYDIRFDLAGEDGTGAPPASIGKYRYIGPIPFADKRPPTLLVNPVNFMRTSYEGEVAPGIGKYVVRMGTSSSEWDPNSRHLVLTFYAPADGDAPQLTEGTYTCSRETFESMTFEQGQLPTFNPKNTYYVDVDAAGLRTSYLVDKGGFTIEKAQTGYRFLIDLGAHPNLDPGRVLIRMVWEGEVVFE